jgi:hypothetical protein
MGGYGSGRSRFRLLVEEARRLDVQVWARDRLLEPGTRFVCSWRNDRTETEASIGVRVHEWYVDLDYAVDGEPRGHAVHLSRSPCHFGGRRTWFNCPGCHRHTARLYLRWGKFRCRRCQRMGYYVENQDYGQRLWIKAERIERKLGPNLTRPKRMRDATYQRLAQRYWDTQERRDAWFDVRLMRRFGRYL